MIISNAELIRRVPLFCNLSDVQIEFIANAVEKVRYRKNQTIVEQGKQSHFLFIVLHGRARVVTKDSRGREVILATLKTGDYVGEMSLIDNEAHSASVVAEVQTDVLRLGSKEFAECLPQSNSMAYAILRSLVQRLRQADRKIESLALEEVHQRVAHVLREVYSNGDESGQIEIRDRPSNTDIAKMIGASREMVGRALKILEDKKFLLPLEDGAYLMNLDMDLDLK